MSKASRRRSPGSRDERRATIAAKQPATMEERTLTFTLEMPLEFDEEAFRDRARAAVSAVARDFGGRSLGWQMNHGALSRARHYGDIARELLGE